MTTTTINTPSRNVVNWFDIPVTSVEKAASFAQSWWVWLAHLAPNRKDRS